MGFPSKVLMAQLKMFAIIIKMLKRYFGKKFLRFHYVDSEKVFFLVERLPEKL